MRTISLLVVLLASAALLFATASLGIGAQSLPKVPQSIPEAQRAKAAPPVLEFDAAGNSSPVGADRAPASCGRHASTAPSWNSVPIQVAVEAINARISRALHGLPSPTAHANH